VAVTAARRTALEVLLSTSRGRRLDLALGAALGALPERDRRWVHEAVYGVARLRGRLDHLLDRHLRGRTRLAPALRDVLRLGAYQLLYMTSVPSYAAVSQSVEQARLSGGSGAASLTNAVLRSLAREGEDPAHFPDPDDDPAGHLSTWGSHPRWLVERWLARWPHADVLSLVERDNRPPPLCLTPLDLSAEDAVARLGEAGIEARPVGWGSGSVELTGHASAGRALERIRAAVQDPGAALVTRYADPPEGARVADLCAAPGGKTLALSGRAAYVLAADRSLPRLRLLRENLSRTGVGAGLVVALAEAPPLREADLVLLDVPCSGTGTLGRHPDARWRLAPEDLGRLAAVQERMLEGAAHLVPIGGLLVYSTCTLEPEENQEQVERFLRRHRGFRVESTGAVEAGLLEGQALVVLPQRTGFDGAFAARLVRTR